MIIDFIPTPFPTAWRKKAVGKLAKTANLTPVADGTVSDLLEYKKKYDVDTCVLLHIAVKPSSVRDVNDFADATNQLDGVAAFGSVHPMGDDVTGQVEDVKARGCTESSSIRLTSGSSCLTTERTRCSAPLKKADCRSYTRRVGSL